MSGQPGENPRWLDDKRNVRKIVWALVIIVEPGAAPGLNPDAVVDMGKMGMGGDTGGMSGG